MCDAVRVFVKVNEYFCSSGAEAFHRFPMCSWLKRLGYSASGR